MNAQLPEVPTDMREILSHASIVLRGVDAAGQTTWERLPATMGEEGTRYEFTVSGALQPGYEWLQIFDAVYAAGRAKGRQAIRADIRQALGL